MIYASLNKIAAAETIDTGAGAQKTLEKLNNPEGQITNPILGERLKDFFNFDDPGATFFNLFFRNLITLTLIIGAIIFFFVLMFGAISWITSGGDKAQIETARGRITAALVGLAILFSIFAIIKVVETFFGTQILTLDIGILKIE
jgi:hypothetical protein